MPRQGKSRKQTPWDDAKVITPTQEFLKMHYMAHYEQHHPKLSETGEARMINSYEPSQCPYCGSERFIKIGYDRNGIRRYKCFCGQTFRPTTGTIFGSRKISISEWIEYCLNIFRYVSLNADSWNNRNAFSTSKYWLKKLFLTLQGSQNESVLSGRVWLDETYYSVLMRDRERNEDGSLLKGISRNQICIGVATDRKHTVCFMEKYGRPTEASSYRTFKSHIASGSVLVHDKDKTHKRLIEKLSLSSESYASADLKKLADSENPMNPVNRIHSLLKMFLNAHSGFNRDDLQGYLDLYAFVINPPSEPLEKVEKIIEMAFHCPKSLRYRDQFNKSGHD